LYNAAKNAAIPQIVSHEKIIRSNSMLTSADSIAMILGPTIGAFLLSTIGISASIAINAGTFFVGAIILSSLSIRTAESSVNQGRFIHDMTDGFKDIFFSKVIRRTLSIWSLLLIGIGPTGLC
jgi:hypothetical protein